MDKKNQQLNKAFTKTIQSKEAKSDAKPMKLGMNES